MLVFPDYYFADDPLSAIAFPRADKLATES